MIIATPIDGGHYFSDVLGGLTIAAGSHVLARRALLSEAAAIAVARAESPAALPATS
jgi:membrane-associated phospholipid phosphatase